MTLVIETRKDITLEAVRRVAWQGEELRLSDAALATMAEARREFLRIIDEDPGVTIYGVTSGYGQMAKKRLSREERKAQAAVPPLAPAASWGDPLPRRVARAILLARLANFVEGHAAVSPAIARGVAEMLTWEDLPAVPTSGQGGAGEILSLSHLFLPLAERNDLAEKDVLCLVNGSPAASALVADTALAAEARLDLAAEVLALSAEAMNTPFGHFAEALEALWNNAHDAWALRRLRSLLEPARGGERRPYQAPVSFRILPRILGQAHRALAQAQEVAAESLAAVSDNPVFLPPEDPEDSGLFVSTGGFHNAQAVMAMDAVSAGSANLCLLAERHMARLLDGAVSLLPDNLVGEGERAGYLGCLAMAGVGYEEEARLNTGATLLPGSESGGFGQNDVASPVFLAWRKQEQAARALEMALASLAPIALRALDLTEREPPAPLVPLAVLIRDAFGPLDVSTAPGPRVAALAERFRSRIYEGRAPESPGSRSA